MFFDERHGGRRGLLGRQHVEDDPARLPPHERQVRQIESAHLIDPVGELVEAVVHVEQRLTAQRRVDALEGLVLEQEIEGADVPDDLALGVLDLSVVGGRDEAALRFGEVAIVVEGERRAHCLLAPDRVLRGRIALRIEVVGRLGCGRRRAQE